tara:strand:+ start:33777 stop:34934 length:1158 start_codon:yes stop_codon:yes gene_type:complete
MRMIIKKFISYLILLTLTSCAYSPNKPITSIDGYSVLEKPSVNFASSLKPKSIEIYFYEANDNYIFPDYIVGFLDNYYFYQKSIGYSPKLKLINIHNKKDCSIENERTSYVVFFNIKTLNLLPTECVAWLAQNSNLIVSGDKNINLNSNNASVFSISRKEERDKIIKFARKEYKRVILIDNKSTNDKTLLSKMWKNSGGVVLNSSSYEESAQTQEMIGKILFLERSNQRKRSLSRVLSEELQFTPRIRGDVDAILLSTMISEARDIRPTIEYSYGDKIPIFLITDWSSEDFYKLIEKDLSNVFISDMPIKFEGFNKKTFGNLALTTRSFGIGYDTYEIMLLNNTRGEKNGLIYKGLTGHIFKIGKDFYRKPLLIKSEDNTFKFLN